MRREKYWFRLLAGAVILLNCTQISFFAFNLFADGEDSEKILVKLVEGAMQEIKKFSEQQLSGCPYSYTVSNTIFFFENEETMLRHKACSNLQKTACELKKDTLTDQLRQSAQLEEKYFKLEERIGHFREKIQKKINALVPSNVLLKENEQEAIDAHIQYLKENGRDQMLNFFINHYVTSGLYPLQEGYPYALSEVVSPIRNSLIAESLREIRQLPLEELKKRGKKIVSEYDWSHEIINRPLETFSTKMEKRPDEEVKKILEEILAKRQVKEQFFNDKSDYFKIVFKRLSNEELENFIKEYIAEQYSNTLNHLRNDLDDDPIFFQEVSALFYPIEKRDRIINIFNAVKNQASQFITENASIQKLEDKQKRTVEKRINLLHLELPSSKQKESETRWHRRHVVDLMTPGYAAHLPTGEIRVSAIDAPYWTTYWALGHEMGHTIHPMESFFVSERKDIRLWKKLSECFESHKGIELHHINEIFSDWFATELLMRAIETQVPPLSDAQKRTAIFQAVDLCAPSENYSPMRSDVFLPNPHPPDDFRINTILRAHPSFNRFFGCPSSPKYCSED